MWLHAPRCQVWLYHSCGALIMEIINSPMQAQDGKSRISVGSVYMNGMSEHMVTMHDLKGGRNLVQLTTRSEGRHTLVLMDTRLANGSKECPSEVIQLQDEHLAAI